MRFEPEIGNYAYKLAPEDLKTVVPVKMSLDEISKIYLVGCGESGRLTILGEARRLRARLSPIA